MTRKLYYEDVYRREFDAVVLSCTESDGRWRIIPDCSAFYPEGGGQSGDRGILTDPETDTQIRVLDTRESGEDVVLICDGPLREGIRFHGAIDWEYRFDRMQNHSGEHIVSGLIHNRFGYNNVGFHMSADRMTIDLDGEIGEEALREIEEQANRIVWENERIAADFYSEEEAAAIEYRSKKELHGEIRVVSIPGADVCACCGTHVERTGEIGPIRILSHEKCRSGIRIEMMCGRWAYLYMTQIFRQNHQVSVLTSSKMHETAAAVGKLMDDHTQLKGQLTGMLYAQIDQKALELKGKGDALLFAPQYTPVLVQKLTARVMEETPAKVFSFAGNDEDGYKYAVGQTGGDLKDLVKEMNAQLSGRGGGKPFFLQGSVSSDRKSIEKYFSDRFERIIIVDV